MLRKDLSEDWLVNPCDPETHKTLLSVPDSGFENLANFAHEPESSYQAQPLLTDEERELLMGFRVAHPDVRQTMVDMARRATKTAEEKIGQQVLRQAVGQ